MDRLLTIFYLQLSLYLIPLAIALVIAANFAFEKLRPKTRENIYGEKVL